MYVLHKTANYFGHQFLNAAKRVWPMFYVDNYLDSFTTEQEAVSYQSEIMELLGKGGFHLTKLISSSRNVLGAIPKGELNPPNLSLYFDSKLPVERTLGVLWDCEHDGFTFKVDSNEEGSTKTHIMSKIASIYNPLGMVAPVVLKVKIIMQETWQCKVDWNDQLSSDLLETWRQWCSELPLLSNVRVPRCYFVPSTDITDRTLDVFSDASELGISSVAYPWHAPNMMTGRLALPLLWQSLALYHTNRKENTQSTPTGVTRCSVVIAPS